MLHLTHETLDTTIDCDDSTGLPLLAEQDVVFELILAYLPLPFSVAEHGCGKKTSMILEQLLSLGVPAYALERGMILEPDMSEDALAEADPEKRSSAMQADNPLAELADLRDPKLRALLEASHDSIRVLGEDAVEAGPFLLHHQPRVQFAVTRSHIFPMVWFWDDDAQETVCRVLDPTLHREGFFTVGAVRERLSSPEALILTAPLFARFRLHPVLLTSRQRERLAELGVDVDALDDLSYDEHADLVRRLNGAAPGSVGDPRTWTYANNVLFNVPESDARQQALTGAGDPLRPAMRALFDARQGYSRSLPELRAALVDFVEQSGMRDDVHRDAVVAEVLLEPLAELAATVSYFNSLKNLADALAEGDDPIDVLLDALDGEGVETLRGFGVSLRARIEKLAQLSEDDLGRIDARALNDIFVRASVETVRQMDRAGLEVFVDRVGNLHGLRQPTASVREPVLCHASHIDTVEDAGKYDGRLGVLSGIEVAHLLADLRQYFDVHLLARGTLQVSSFVGEEMSFTGCGVSMPGSAAVAGLTSVKQVHGMTNGDGELYGERLLVLLRALRREQEAGRLRLATDLVGVDLEDGVDPEDGEALLAACAEPTRFFTRHSYERHIEQGPQLDRRGVPLVLVGTIMGMLQVDYFVEGAHAEPAALEMNLRCRELLGSEKLRGARLTVGILEEQGDDVCVESPAMAQHWTFHGERNHAGSTALEDRRDPGVAAARLARELRRWVEAYNREVGDAARVKPLIGGVALLPGTGRNVIPDTALLKVGLEGEVPRQRQVELSLALRTFAVETLSREVEQGGEGILLCETTPESFLNTARSVRLSVDLRAADDATLEHGRAELERVARDLEKAFGVRISSRVEQEVAPYPLARSGQVLQIERSYAGSHNPNEMELGRDLVRGLLVQLATTCAVLGPAGSGPGRAADEEDLNLFERVHGFVPEAWRARCEDFVSGALHDTCNLTAATLCPPPTG